jgi:hypothetical protein
MTFKCERTGISFRAKDKEYDRNYRLRCALTKAHLSIFKYLEVWDINHHKLRCAWCNDYNHDIRNIVHLVDNGNIIPVSVERRHSAPFLCFSKNPCESKKLNKNSVEFISKSYGLSNDQALLFLHSRNKTPFYRTNHESLDNYKISQSRSNDWFSKNKKDRDEWINKANYSRSVVSYASRGEEKRWKEIQKSKGISLDSMISRYGQEIGKIKYNHWKEEIDLSLDTYIRKYGKIKGTEQYLKTRMAKNDQCTNEVTLFEQFLHKIISIIKNHPLYEYNLFNIDKIMKYYKFYQIGKEFFELTAKDLNDEISKISDVYRKNHRRIFYNKWAQYSYTENGTILKSLNEIRVYDFLIMHGLKENDDFSINGRYPNSKLCYDVYLKIYDVYIEIAGGTSLEYKKHMEEKNLKFNSVILDPKDYKETLLAILNRKI